MSLCVTIWKSSLLWSKLSYGPSTHTFGYRISPCYLNLLYRYEEAKSKGVDNYDRDLEDVIDRLIVECDRKITRSLKRLDEEDAKAAIAISVSEVTQVFVT